MVLSWLVHSAAHLDFTHHGVKHNDFCCFKGVIYVVPTLCYKLTSFYTDFCCYFNH